MLAQRKPVDEPTLLRIWARHMDVLPSFDTFKRQNMGAVRCGRCGVEHASREEWQRRTELVEEFNLIAGGQTWQRRRCHCGSERSLPIGR